MATQRSAIFWGIALGCALVASVPVQAKPVLIKPPRRDSVARTAAEPYPASAGRARRVVQGLRHGAQVGARLGAKRGGHIGAVGGALVGPIGLIALLASTNGSGPTSRAAALVGTPLLAAHAAAGGGFVGWHLGQALGAVGGAVTGGLWGAAREIFTRAKPSAVSALAGESHAAP
jgi:hypothetical protein